MRRSPTGLAALGLALALAATVACGGGEGDDGPIDQPAPLAPLPPPAPAATDRFADSAACAQCHLARDDSEALRDADGRDVSPVGLWRASMMALAARDPYYLAAFSDELASAPAGAAAAIEQTCVRCHGPAGSEEADAAGRHLGFDALTAGDAPEAALARDGVTCTLCHQIVADNLGTSASYAGGFRVGYGREIYGRYEVPLADPMMLFVRYTPTYGPHVADAALCGSCHTVIVRGVDAGGAPTGPEVVEQATYLEWKNSDHAADRPCQACHVPTIDEDGAAIETPVATTPASVPARQPVGRHVFVGGNAYVLRLLADGAAWAGHGVPPAELEAAALRSEAHLAEAAWLTIAEARRDGDALVVRVAIENQTGHKLPTGYPSRRAWLHLRVVDGGGAVVFESGAIDGGGRLVDGGGAPLDEGALRPHRDAIDGDDQVQVYEAVLVDDGGAPTHRALAARGYGKDNRLLPTGWRADGPDAARTAPVGVAGDPDFAAGGDQVTYRVAAAPAGALTVEVALRYQPVRPTAVEHLAAVPTAAAARFVELATARPPETFELASTTATVP